MTEQPTTFYVIPCGGAKATTRTAARDLYVGSAFQLQLRTAEALVADHAAEGETARVLILSARHGLVTLDTVLSPYDTRMTDADAITTAELTATAVAAGVEYGDQVYALLPSGKSAPYFQALRDGLDELCVWPQPVYEAAPGIGYQRGVCSSVLASLA